MNEQPHWMQVLVMSLGELAFVIPGIPLYMLLVLPNHPAGALPGLVPAIGVDADPAWRLPPPQALWCWGLPWSMPSFG